MRYTVASPERRFTGEVAGVAFANGRAEVDDDDAHARALAYFRRKGYDVQPVGEPAPAVEQANDNDSEEEPTKKTTGRRAATSKETL